MKFKLIEKETEAIIANYNAFIAKGNHWLIPYDIGYTTRRKNEAEHNEIQLLLSTEHFTVTATPNPDVKMTENGVFFSEIIFENATQKIIFNFSRCYFSDFDIDADTELKAILKQIERRRKIDLI